MATGNPYLDAAQQTQQGNLLGAQQATAANRINQNTPYQSLNYSQGVDANGNPTWTANQSYNGQLGNAFNNLQGQLAQSTANPFDISQFQAGQVGQGPDMQRIGAAAQQQGIGNAPMLSQVGQGPQFSGIGNAANLQTQVQGTGMQGWDQATGLLMNRLNPQINQNQDRLRAQLANQGIAQGTEAYNRALTQQGQQENDLRVQAQLAGSQIQNQMFNQNLQAGQFGNQALTQQNSNQLANLGFNNQLGQQGFANQLAGTQFNNASALSGNQAQLANLGFTNQAQQQNYANQQAMLQQNNAAAQQQFANRMAGTQANNAALQQNYQQALAQRNLPLQQLGAFNQATQAGYVNPYSQAAVSGPDYLGAYSTQNAARIAEQNAANARAAGNTAGLYGLGSAAILGSGGLSNLAKTGSGLLDLGKTGLSGLTGLYDYFNTPSYIGPDFGVNPAFDNSFFDFNSYD